jgi:hypothetical protein
MYLDLLTLTMVCWGTSKLLSFSLTYNLVLIILHRKPNKTFQSMCNITENRNI